MSFSSILENSGRIETGRQFENSSGLSALNKGITLAIFNSVGTTPCVIEAFNILVNGVRI